VQKANKDDLAIIINRIVTVMGQSDTRDGTRNLWSRVIAAIIENRERLQSLGLSL
jgi:hypothetical protein